MSVIDTSSYPATLEEFIDKSLQLCDQKRYYSGDFRRMRQISPLIPLIKKLVEKGAAPSGYQKTCKLGLKDWTLEAAVVRYSDRFEKSTIQAAEFRLREDM